MDRQPAEPTAAPASTSGSYTHGYSRSVVQGQAEREGGFFLSHLRPGMRVLDVGCGPGTITLGFARAVMPGEVVGIDREPAMVHQAEVLAAERGVANVRFEVGSAEELPYLNVLEG